MRACVGLTFLGLMLAGCAADMKSDARSGRFKDAAKKDGPRTDDKPKSDKGREPAGGEAAPDEPMLGAPHDRGFKRLAAPAVKEVPVEKPRPRLVVYTGKVELLVEDFDDGQKKLAEVIEANKAFVSHSAIMGEPGEPRSGIWTIRVPVAGFDALLDAVAGLGEARKKSKDSDDVTERYFDTEALALNLEAREKSLRKLYEQTKVAAKVAEIMEVDRELNKVRGDINVYRGQMKRWDNLASFSTLEVSMRDRKGYVPPESPVYTTQIGRAWGNSIEALVSTGKAIFLFAVIVTPWLGVLVVLGFVIGIPLRRMLRRHPIDEPDGPPPL